MIDNTSILQVKVLVWDDRSSLSVFGKAFMGAMGTFDEQCRTWFRDNAPEVQLKVVPREGHKALSTLESTVAATCFSHHQARSVQPLPCADLSTGIAGTVITEALQPAGRQTLHSVYARRIC